MALWSICFFGVRPIASIVDGAVASTCGVRIAGVVMSVPALLAATIVAKRSTLSPRTPSEDELSPNLRSPLNLKVSGGVVTTCAGQVLVGQLIQIRLP